MDELSPEQRESLLTTSTIAHLAVISEGEPYVGPISFVLVGDAICVRTGPGRRVEALRSNPRVCVEVSAFDDFTGDWESVIVWGDAEFVESQAEEQEIIAAFFDKYRNVLGSPLNPGEVSLHDDKVAIRIPIELADGRSSGSFFSVRTRPGRL